MYIILDKDIVNQTLLVNFPVNFLPDFYYNTLLKINNENTIVGRNITYWIKENSEVTIVHTTRRRQRWFLFFYYWEYSRHTYYVKLPGIIPLPPSSLRFQILGVKNESSKS